jgi:prolyl oligopeptidase PreP (S9A serine peptidase family)
MTAIDGDESDQAVHPFHVRKMAAALQAASPSASTRPPVLIRIDRPARDASGLFDLELRDIVDQRAFLMWQLGIAATPQR